MADQSESEKAKADGKAKHRHQLIDPDDCSTVISTKWLVEGLVPLKESTFVFGPPKNLKTFLVLALVLCVATDREFFGLKVRLGKVLYIIGEGSDAFLGRIKAWQTLNNAPTLRGQFKYDKRIINLFADDGVDSVGAVFAAMQVQGFRPDVVVIDTLGRAMGGAKETTEDFNKIFANLDTMAQDCWPGVTLIVVGHTRKGDMTYRGPQVIAGDCDNMIYVERLGKELKADVHCEFCRNGSEFDSFGFTLTARKVETEDGPQEFLAVDALATPFKTETEAETDDKVEDLAWRTLLSFYKGPDHWTQWADWFKATKTARGGKLGNTTFSTAVKSLLKKGRVQINAKGLYQVVFGPAAEGGVGGQTWGETPSAYSSPPLLPLPDKDRGVGVVGGATPRSTPGVGSESTTGKGKGENSVVKDERATGSISPELIEEQKRLLQRGAKPPDQKTRKA